MKKSKNSKIEGHNEVSTTEHASSIDLSKIDSDGLRDIFRYTYDVLIGGGLKEPKLNSIVAKVGKRRLPILLLVTYLNSIGMIEIDVSIMHAIANDLCGMNSKKKVSVTELEKSIMWLLKNGYIESKTKSGFISNKSNVIIIGREDVYGYILLTMGGVYKVLFEDDKEE